jgi:hypothetical protein
MTETPESDPRSATPEEEERPDVERAMATYSADGQGDDETGGDAAAGAVTEPGSARGEGDREPHGPV